MKFRVWCLDWSDTEDDACSVGSGQIGDHIETRRTLADWRVTNAASAAERYSSYCHNHRDGWEATWPLTFRVLSKDGSVQDFEVEREMMPEFSASPVKTKVGAP